MVFTILVSYTLWEVIMRVFTIILLFTFNACLFPQSYDRYKAKSYNNFNNNSYNKYKNTSPYNRYHNPAPYDTLRGSYMNYENRYFYRQSRRNCYNNYVFPSRNLGLYHATGWYYPYAIQIATYDIIIKSELGSPYPNFPKINLYLNKKLRIRHLMNK